MAPICSKGAVQSAKEGHRGSGIGKSPKNKVIQTQREKTGSYPSCQNANENKPQRKRLKRISGGKSI
jgi:hypothetical protein